MTRAISQQGERHQFDAIVVGAGLAGLSYALALATHRPDARIVMISKKQLHQANSYWAQGGIASATLQSDSFEKHFQDTLQAGDGLCDEEVVREVCQQAPKALQFLMQHGVNFDRDPSDQFDLGQEGGHSERRVYHVGDHTGKAIMQVLIEKVIALPNVTIYENHAAVNLITQIAKHKPGARREVVGAYVLDESTGLIHTVLAKSIVLATGGAGKVYRYTSNSDVATGDGVAMAYRAGARVGNLEFYQFHPTLLYHPQCNNFLISEAMRGEGAHLCAVKDYERFMQRYAPKQKELATRDVVARAIFNELESTASKHVYLDVRHLSKAYIAQRFPSIFQTVDDLGIDIEKEGIPVVPGAHYMCGGVLANLKGQTDLTRLYAIGETAFTGLHGANRLACNSLLEAVVMGRLAAEQSLCDLDQALTLHRDIHNWDSKSVVNTRRASQINAQWRGLRGEMSSYAGIVRTKEGLQVLLKLILIRKELIESYYWRHEITRDMLELRNIVLVAELIVRAALSRQETRGGHYREDFPERLAVAEETVLRTQRESRISSNLFERPSE